ncbi:ABC transporter substrate-binding protein [Pontibacillus halophilus JSM 076056 = DSM 19796]|uniref:ABC transporter substrate-binding protein n=2 Tax=Pontibacillus TaxID=289201 RepID=A0A0A5I409_9BACI|nr:ABC transporter substrate-binding protein [Pontibacillus halophilus JSM 076056 = DSM 19796]
MKHVLRISFMMLLLFISACSANATDESSVPSVGLLTTESGLGDGSFSDSALQGLERAREELEVTFDYREPLDGDYEASLRELIERDHALIIGLAYQTQPAIEKLAEEYPDQQFAIIDSVSELPNVSSITFKENEGSYLIGLIAGMRTETNEVGFIGGEDTEVIQRFETGFVNGVKDANKEATIQTTYTGSFDDDQLGAEAARKMIEQDADFLFPVAGYTGLGVLEEAQKSNIYAFGVDSDQFFLAEKAVVTSMLKRIDNAVYDLAKSVADKESLTGDHTVLGLKEDGVGLAPIRLIQLTNEEQETLDAALKEGEE